MKLFLSGLMLLISGLCVSAAPPNVLIVLSDDHSAAHVGCYGNADIQTPNLDAFAKSGLRCDRAYVTCPQCVPSRASIMTGRSPIDIEMTRFSAPLPAEYKTWLEHLRVAGYFTGVAGRTFHLDGASGPDMKPVFDKHNLRTFQNRLDFVKSAGTGSVSVAQFKEFLDAKPQDKPFALQLCFNDPHRAYNAPKVHDPKKITLPKHYPDTELVREDFAAYYDAIHRFDADFGKVLAELDQRKLAANTIILFMGDNGAAQWRGKGTLYEYGINVPLIIRWPGVVKPSATTELISGEDLAPTLLEATGQKVPSEMTGVSFAKLLKGEAFTGRKFIFAERGAHGGLGLPGKSSVFDLGRVVVSKHHKLIYNAMYHLPYDAVDFGGTKMFEEVRTLAKEKKLAEPLNALYDGRARPMLEMFDLTKDPSEFVNIIGMNAEVEAELRAALIEWMILQRDFVPLPVRPQAKK